MRKRAKSFIKPIMTAQKAINFIGLILVALMLSACEGSRLYNEWESTKPPAPPAPGLYGLTGWNYTKGDTDINGEVGHPLFVNGPTARCEPSRDWSMAGKIISGTLPPGLTLGSAASNITGIPTERGHWIVNLELYNVSCGFEDYKGFTQQLRFHITGTGKVIK